MSNLKEQLITIFLGALDDDNVKQINYSYDNYKDINNNLNKLRSIPHVYNKYGCIFPKSTYKMIEDKYGERGVGHTYRTKFNSLILEFEDEPPMILTKFNTDYKDKVDSSIIKKYDTKVIKEDVKFLGIKINTKYKVYKEEYYLYSINDYNKDSEYIITLGGYICHINKRCGRLYPNDFYDKYIFNRLSSLKHFSNVDFTMEECGTIHAYELTMGGYSILLTKEEYDSLITSYHDSKNRKAERESKEFKDKSIEMLKSRFNRYNG